MRTEIIITGGGASGLMAGYSAASEQIRQGRDVSVTVLEKMPRPARKMMITGKGRCNFTNVKEWNEFSAHIRSRSNFVKSAFHGFTPRKTLEFFESMGVETVVERGDRAFPSSYHASDIVDALVNACLGCGVKLETDAEVVSVSRLDSRFVVKTADGRSFTSSRLILATGGLSYPGTGSTGDGYRFAEEVAGHSVTQTFPSLTALVPEGYKQDAPKGLHIHRETPLSEIGASLCGLQLKNVGVTLLVQDTEAASEFGDIDFTDGGIEGPVGFQLSRKAVKSMVNGSRTALVIDLKYGVSLTELTARVKDLWKEVDRDPRSVRLREKEKCRIMLGKLMPRELIPAFTALHPGIMTLERRSRTETKVWVNLVSIAKALKAWRFDIAGYVGYERCVVTAGGVSTEEVSSKTMESKLCPGLYFCGELLDIDSDTGGYNLQTAFSTGRLAGMNAAKPRL